VYLVVTFAPPPTQQMRLLNHLLGVALLDGTFATSVFIYSLMYFVNLYSDPCQRGGSRRAVETARQRLTSDYGHNFNIIEDVLVKIAALLP
jgi:hypothetical protein